MTRDPKIWPDPTQLADEDDELGWDRERDGKMADQAAPDDAVITVPFGEGD